MSTNEKRALIETVLALACLYLIAWFVWFDFTQ